MASQICTLAVTLLMLNTAAHASHIDVVLAHHSEDLSWVSQIPKDVHGAHPGEPVEHVDSVHLHIYTKGLEKPRMPFVFGTSVSSFLMLVESLTPTFTTSLRTMITCLHGLYFPKPASHLLVIKVTDLAAGTSWRVMPFPITYYLIPVVRALCTPQLCICRA